MRRREWEKLLHKLTFIDNEEEEIACYQFLSSKDVMLLPRGAWSMLPDRLAVNDLRSCPSMPKVGYVKDLGAEGFEGQREAVVEMFKNEQGQVIAPPGRGKTEIGLAFAATCKTRTLVVVHTKDLFDQWVARAAESTPGFSVGKIQGGCCQIEHLTIAMAQTLKRYIQAGGKFWRKFGCLIIDEAHHAAAETWEWILNVCPAKYHFGLTATERRADGRHPLVRFLIGPVIYKMKFQSKVPIEVVPVLSGFRGYRGPNDWSRMLRRLSIDEERNRRIAEIVNNEIEAGNSVLVLSRQINHLGAIAEAIGRLRSGSQEWEVVTGQMSQRRRRAAIEGLRDGSVRCLLATQLADEGLDVQRLNRIVLTFPGKHDGRIIQQIGRSIRQHPDKIDAVIYDIVDDLVPPLARQYVARRETYKTLGIKIRKAVRHDVEKKERRKLRDRFQVRRIRSTDSRG